MLRITQLNDKFVPLTVSEKSVKICFDYEPFYDTDEEGNKIETEVGT